MMSDLLDVIGTGKAGENNMFTHQGRIYSNKLH